MCEKVCYIDTERGNLNKLVYFYKCLLNKFDVIAIDNEKIYIDVYNGIIDKKIYTKIMKKIRNNNFKIVLSNKIQMKENLDKKYTFDGKLLMKHMILQVINYIEQCVDYDFRAESIFVTMNDERNFEYIQDIAGIFKDINIVTNRIKKLNRMYERLSKQSDLIVSLQNNRKKSLKRAKIIINFDEDFFKTFYCGRNCIIINLYKDKLNMRNSFHGVVIEGIDIKYNYNKNRYLEPKNYNNSIFYESCMYSLNHKVVKEKIAKDNVKIIGFFGSRGVINKSEIKNNFIKKTIKLDKLEKKD